MRKQLLLVAFTLLAVIGFSSKIAALNSYAYGLSSSLSEDKSTLTVNYSLNADAQSVEITVYNGETPVAGKSYFAGDEIKAGVHSTEIATTSFPAGVDLKWEVTVESNTVSVPTVSDKTYQFFHPQGVSIDLDTKSPNFGRILVTECMLTTNAKYHSSNAADGQGIYAFDPQLNPIKNANGTYAFKGGITYDETFSELSKSAYEPRKIRIAEDGRIFVTRQNASGPSLYEVNPSNLNADFTEIFKGTSDPESYELRTEDGKFITSANIGFDTKGSGENLKLLMLSANKSGIGLAQSGFRLDEYNLGSATTWDTEPSKAIEALSQKYTISYANTNVVYDNKGGIWYVQYRAAPTGTQPAIVHINAEGVEDYKDIVTVSGGAGVKFNKDFSLLAIANKKASVGVYAVGEDEKGKPTLTLKYEFATTIGTNCNDIAWDYANNIYIVGNSGEWLKVFSAPLDSPYTITPSEGTINIPEEKKLYIIGQIDETNYTWEANIGYEMLETTESGVYQTVVRIANSDNEAGTPAFAFATKLGANAGDWTTLNANRYGPQTDATRIYSGIEAALVKSEGAYSIKGGKYLVIVDMNKMTVKCSNLDNPASYSLTEMSTISTNIPAAGDGRQSSLVNGKLYIQDRATQKVSTWTTEGKNSTEYASGIGINICHDEKGNIIVRNGTLGNSFAEGEKLLVYPYNGGDAVEVTISGIPTGRCDFFGNAKGSILADPTDATKTGTLYLVVNGSKNLIEISFKDGVQTGIKTYALINSNTDSSSIAFPYNDNIVIAKRSESYRLASITDGTLDDSKALVTPGKNGVNGCSIFTMGGTDYILYPTQTNYRDGFAIAEVSTETNNPKLVEYTETLTANPNLTQTNWLAAEVLSDTRALIYQYVPGAFIKVHEFSTSADPTTYPEALYAIGNTYFDSSKQWNPADDTQILAKTENEGEYNGNIRIYSGTEQYGYFSIGGTPSSDWVQFNADRFGPKVSDTLLKDKEIEGGVTRNGDTSYKVIGNKIYNVLINLKRGFITITEKGVITGVENNIAAQEAKVVAGVGEIQIIGEANSIKVFTTSGILISSNSKTINCNAGIYLVTVDGKTTKVIVK